MINNFIIMLAIATTLNVFGESGIYLCHTNDNKKIALTFDDGPHEQYTPEILDILNEYGIKATFFVIGTNIELYPDIVTRTIQEGHEIGNHTYHHNKYRDNDLHNIENEIAMNEKILYEVAEYKPKIFRPPGGYCCSQLAETTSLLDYAVVLWSIDTRDWRVKSPQKIADTVIENIKAGDIILCHDYVDINCTPEALRIFIPELIDMGYKFVTVSELITSK